ncbi:MAG: aquaporin [Bacteroidota bacterium]|nr:aquaporin [Bacteroidota bacterium]
MENNAKKLLVEFIGTCIFFYIGAGAIITDKFSNGAVGLLGIALAHGLILSVMVSVFGSISGAHFNPAVTFGVMVSKRISAPLALQYIVAQLAGGVLAGVLLRLSFSAELCTVTHLGTPAVASGVSLATAVLIEALLTFFLVTSVFGTAIDPRAPKIGGFGIGLTVMVDILVGGPLTGASMNPARTFGPALVAGFWEAHWVYWVGPLIGGGLAGFVYERFIMEKQ